MRYSLLLLVFGCSAVVNPDGTRLGGGEGVDAGRDAGSDGGGLDGAGVDSDIDTGCSVPPSCDGATRVFCAGGRLQMEVCPAGCNPDSGTCIGAPTGFQPSNVGREQFRMDAPDLILDPTRSGTYDTSECDPDSGVARVVRLADGSEACVLSLGDFTIESGTRFLVVGSRALIIVSSGEITIEGELDASARGVAPGPGGFAGDVGGMGGRGPGGGGAGAHQERFADGGGGGGGACGIGGGGGIGVGGMGTDALGGTPGMAWAGLGADFQPLLGGSGGGRGQGAEADGGRTNAGAGGAGGGAIQLTALERVRVRGTILVGGGGGQAGQAFGGTGVNWGSGGGGGAGGTVLLEAPVVQSMGTIALTGGGGGGSAQDSRAGSPGTDGRLAGRAPGGEPGGGAGAGADSLPGEPGDDGEPPAANGGGGGGGAGCLVIRSDSPPTTGAFNPSVSRPTLLPLRR